LDVLRRTQDRVPEEDRTLLDLRGANLQGAILQGAKVTANQLGVTRSLKDATMPDGQKYEDWIKVKEGSGKDGENE
jgi:uncharacterized protein YjbI with pentapeptide repeats